MTVIKSAGEDSVLSISSCLHAENIMSFKTEVPEWDIMAYKTHTARRDDLKPDLWDNILES